MPDEGAAPQAYPTAVRHRNRRGRQTTRSVRNANELECDIVEIVKRSRKWKYNIAKERKQTSESAETLPLALTKQHARRNTSETLEHLNRGRSSERRSRLRNAQTMTGIKQDRTTMKACGNRLKVGRTQATSRAFQIQRRRAIGDSEPACA